jgi:N-acetylmuramoyl-L-alanine amidase
MSLPVLALLLACGEETVTPDTGGSPPGDVSPWSTVVVTGSVVNLRAGPDTSFEVLGSVTAGDTLRVTGGTVDWYRIYIPERSLFAWIYAGLTSGAELP